MRPIGPIRPIQISRSALVIGNLAALIAGSNPPITPATIASPTANTATCGEIVKLNAT